MFLFSPLEQFLPHAIIRTFSLPSFITESSIINYTPFFEPEYDPFLNFDFIVGAAAPFIFSTNFSCFGVLILILLTFFILIFALLEPKSKTLAVIPDSLPRVAIESIYVFLLSLVSKTILGDKSQKFFPLIFSIFLLILMFNIFGFLPGFFTLSSSSGSLVILTFFLFFWINCIGFYIHNLNFLSLFLPKGTSLLLAFIIIPIELLLYTFRPISLTLRLLCNIITGHILVKIMIFQLAALPVFFGFIAALYVLPFIIGLELGVAVLQAYVYSLLFCVYCNDVINLH